VVQNNEMYNLYSIIDIKCHLLKKIKCLPKIFKCHYKYYYILDQKNNVYTSNYSIKNVNYIVPNMFLYNEFMYCKNNVLFIHRDTPNDIILENYYEGKILSYYDNIFFVQYNNSLCCYNKMNIRNEVLIGESNIPMCINSFYKIWSPDTHLWFKPYIQLNVLIVLLCHKFKFKMYLPKYVLFNIIRNMLKN